MIVYKKGLLCFTLPLAKYKVLHRLNEIEPVVLFTASIVFFGILLKNCENYSINYAGHGHSGPVAQYG